MGPFGLILGVICPILGLNVTILVLKGPPALVLCRPPGPLGLTALDVTGAPWALLLCPGVKGAGPPYKRGLRGAAPYNGPLRAPKRIKFFEKEFKKKILILFLFEKK